MAMSTIQSPIIWTPRYKLCDVIFTILKKYLMGETFDVYSIMRPLATSTYKKTKMQYTELKQKC